MSARVSASSAPWLVAFALAASACGPPSAPPTDASPDVETQAPLDAGFTADSGAPLDAGRDVSADAPIDAPAPVIYCGHPSDCPASSTCAADGTCKPGDCLANPCIRGFICNASHACTWPTASGCDTDRDCASGSACIDGACRAVTALCIDGSQCVARGARCLEGKCVPTCAADSDCPASFRCDVRRGVCSVPRTPCVITNDCGGPSAVCVEGACVPRSADGTCAATDVWFDNGCVRSTASASVCSATGTRDTCAAGSICIDRTCFISCDAPTPNACANQAVLNNCKPVTTTSGTFNVCATARSLGNECSAPSGRSCSGDNLCVDGFCK